MWQKYSKRGINNMYNLEVLKSINLLQARFQSEVEKLSEKKGKTRSEKRELRLKRKLYGLLKLAWNYYE